MAPLPEPVLDVDLLGLVARERDVHAGERSLGDGLLPVELVEEVVGEAALAEEQPALAPVAALAPVLDEGPERRHAGARADHHDRYVAALGQAEVAVRAQVGPDRGAGCEPLRGIARRHALPLAAMRLVRDLPDQQVRLVRMGQGRARDRVGAGRQRAQQRGQLVGLQPAREGLEQVHHLTARHELPPALAFEQAGQPVLRAQALVGLERRARERGDVELAAQALRERLVRDDAAGREQLARPWPDRSPAPASARRPARTPGRSRRATGRDAP